MLFVVFKTFLNAEANISNINWWLQAKLDTQDSLLLIIDKIAKRKEIRTSVRPEIDYFVV
jgi:hypothetical protein